MTSSLERVRSVLQQQADTLRSIPVNSAVDAAVEAILGCHGKLFTAGIGKAGYIARKAASTFCTTGTPSVFLHPGDASHGDVGVVSKGDILLTFSNSGKNREILETVLFCRKLAVDTVISITATDDSPLAQESDIVLELGQIAEACPLGLTPTSSTSAMMALSDALAVVVMELRGFSKEDFAIRHHGGYLGRKLRAEET